MDAEKILDYVKKRLEKIEEMEYSKHAEKEAMPDRKLSKTEIEETLRSLGDLLSAESQNDRYKLIFTKGTRHYLVITVRFIGDRKLRIITAYPMSSKRLKRYLTWLQKLRK